MRVRNSKGQALIETAVAGMVIVPIMLFLLDVAVLVLCNISNDAAAKNAARAAANQPQATAQQAAQNTIASFKKSAIIGNLTIKDFNYTKSHDAVTVTTQMDVNLPVQFPFMPKPQFVAQSVQPIVAE